MAGFYERSKHAKVWVVTDDDVGGMYTKYPNGGEITLMMVNAVVRQYSEPDYAPQYVCAAFTSNLLCR